MTIYEVRYRGETIVAYTSYEDALKKVRQLYNKTLDDRYEVVRVEKEPLE